MEKEKRNIGVIGCGIWGRNIVRNFYNLNALNTVCDIDKDNIEAQVYYGRIDENGVVDDISIIPLTLENADEENRVYTYKGKVNLVNGGNYGYTFRVMPKHEMLLDKENLNLIKWITK